MGRRILSVGAILCAMALPVFGATTVSLFGFDISNPSLSFNTATGVFSVDVWLDGSGLAGTSGKLYRNRVPMGTADFPYGQWGTTADFDLSMNITGDPSTGHVNGAGTFSFMDVDGDVVDGAIVGTWDKIGTSALFNGQFQGVKYKPSEAGEGTFDGNAGSVSMDFSPYNIWEGSLTWITQSGTWFNRTYSGVTGGSIDVIIDGTHCPVPGALSLTLLGMASALGLRRRRSL